MIIHLIRAVAPPGTIIPKPEKGEFRIKGDGMRRGQDAIIYLVPNHINPKKPTPKGINASEFEAAYKQLIQTESLTCRWFKRYLPKCYKEGHCNFTTTGGLFELLGIAKYQGKGVYIKIGSISTYAGYVSFTAHVASPK